LTQKGWGPTLYRNSDSHDATSKTPPNAHFRRKITYGYCSVLHCHILITKAGHFAKPVQVSEKGLFFIAFGILLLGAAAWLLRRALTKV